MAEQNDNSGMGVILGILVAVAIAIGGYYFLKSEGQIGDGSMDVTNIEMPDVNVNAPDAPNAPSVEPAAE